MAWNNLPVSLQVELTRFIPAALGAAATGFRAALDLARDLKNSGSDIVVEEDLAALFGRNLIEPEIAENFSKTILPKGARYSIFSESIPIVLWNGPSATVNRALKNKEYFPMVIQISLLTAAHDVESLADGLSEALRLRSKGLDTKVPSSESLLGFLRACAEQTAAFDWLAYLDSVRQKLGLPYYVPDRRKANIGNWFQMLTVPLLQASLDMLPSVQRLYEDSMMVIDGSIGSTTMVVWAHYVLGLSVKVEGAPNGNITFGEKEPSLIIRINDISLQQSLNPVYLMNASEEIMLAVQESEDSLITGIEASRRIPLYGYARRVFEMDEVQLGPAGLTEMICLSAAWALLIAPRLRECLEIDPADGQPCVDFSRSSIVAAQYNLNKSISLICGDQYFDRNIVDNFMETLRDEQHPDGLYDLKPTPAVSSNLKSRFHPPLSDKEKASHWYRLIEIVEKLCPIILSFAAVGNIDELCLAQNLYIEKMNILSDLPGVTIEDSKEPFIRLDSDTCLKIIAYYITGKSRDQTGNPLNRFCLASGGGWSVFTDSLWDKDPAEVTPGRIWLKRGVPYHNSSFGHFIIDGPLTIDSHAPSCIKDGRLGQKFKPFCAVDVASTQYMVALRKDNFYLTRRFRVENCKSAVTVGYWHFSTANFYVMRGDRCSHEDSQGLIELGLDMASFKGFAHLENNVKERIRIALTHGNSNARWLMVAAVGMEEGIVFLKTPGCCLNCLLRKASEWKGKCIIIL
jgi:hypothetical protein